MAAGTPSGTHSPSPDDPHHSANAPPGLMPVSIWENFDGDDFRCNSLAINRTPRKQPPAKSAYFETVDCPVLPRAVTRQVEPASLPSICSNFGGVSHSLTRTPAGSCFECAHCPLPQGSAISGGRILGGAMRSRLIRSTPGRPPDARSGRSPRYAANSTTDAPAPAGCSPSPPPPP